MVPINKTSWTATKETVSTRKSIPINTVSRRQTLSFVDSEMDCANASKAFLELFPLRINSSIKALDSATWRPVSQFHYLTDQEILDVLEANSRRLRSFSFDSKSRFAVIVLPADSPYASPEGFGELRDFFSKAEIPIAAYKAAGSDDIHLYIFFDEAVQSELIREQLLTLLTQAGFVPTPQTLSVYPDDKQLSYPLQNGFAWLNNNLQVFRKREDLTTQQAIELFLAHLSQNQVSIAHLTTLINQPSIHLDQSDEAVQSIETIHFLPTRQSDQSDQSDSTDPSDEFGQVFQSAQTIQPDQTTELAPPVQTDYTVSIVSTKHIVDLAAQLVLQPQENHQISHTAEPDQLVQAEQILDIGFRHIQDLAVQVVSIIDLLQQTQAPAACTQVSDSIQVEHSEYSAIELNEAINQQADYSAFLNAQHLEDPDPPHSDVSLSTSCLLEPIHQKSEYPESTNTQHQDFIPEQADYSTSLITEYQDFIGQQIDYSASMNTEGIDHPGPQKADFSASLIIQHLEQHAPPHADASLNTQCLQETIPQQADYSRSIECHQQPEPDPTHYLPVLGTEQHALSFDQAASLERLPVETSTDLLTQFEQPDLNQQDSELPDNTHPDEFLPPADSPPRPKKSKTAACKPSATKSIATDSTAPTKPAPHADVPQEPPGMSSQYPVGEASAPSELRHELPGQLSIFSSILNFTPMSSPAAANAPEEFESQERAPPLTAT